MNTNVNTFNEAMAAVKNNGLALQYASEGLRANEETVLKAIQQHLGAIHFSKLGDETNKRLLNKVRLMSKFVKPEAFGLDDFVQENNNRLSKELLATNEHFATYLAVCDLPGLFVNRHARDLYLPTANKITSELNDRNILRHMC